MKRFVLILALAALLASCATNPPRPESMVLEGWIDADGHPVVMIHKSYVMTNAPDSSMSLEDIVEEQLIPFGKVTVSDGDEELILTGRLDTAYLPPYTYSTINMTGQVGKRYTVTAKYKDMYATASTTIPPIAYLDSLSIRTDTTGKADVRAYISGTDTCAESYYALFARETGTKQFCLCPFGVFDGKEAQNGLLEMSVYNPITDTTKVEAGFSTNFFYRDTATTRPPKEYQLKVARIDYPSYQFWKAYNEQVITGGVLFVTVYKNMPSNIVGGIGNFSGFGSSFYRLSIQKDTTYRF